jgi:hypothetical protein
MEAWNQFNEVTAHLLEWSARSTINSIQQTEATCLDAYQRFMEPRVKLYKKHARAWSSCERQRFNDIVEQLELVPAVKDLIVESFNGNGIPVYFSKPQGMFSEGHCDANNKIIHLRNDLSIPTTTAILIFEMCNAARCEHFPLPSEFKSADEYALNVEYVEYGSCVRFVRVMKSVACSESVLALLAPEEVQVIERMISSHTVTWEQYWRCACRVVEAQGYSHMESYRRDFRKQRS